MQVTFRSSFLRDLKKIKDQRLLDRIDRAIESGEQATDLHELSDLKKLSGFHDFYRIRIGDYHLGIALADKAIEFVRCLPRKEMYRFFP